MKSYFMIIMYKIISYIMCIFRIFGIKNNKVYVINFTDKGFTDNPKYIINELILNKHDVEVYWKGSNNSFSYNNITAVKSHSLCDFYHLSTAKVILSNVRLPLYYRKRSNQFYIETWHGSIAFKKIGYDGNNRNILSDKKVKHFCNSCDIITSNSEYANDLYRRAFKYNGSIELTGTPRVDALYNSDRYKLYKRLNIQEGELVITYAPTFREKGMTGFVPLDYKTLINIFENKYGRKVRLLFRLHPTKTMDLGDFKHGTIVSDDLMDVYETLSITDILISDYSSLIFEYMILRRPIIQYIPDLESYKNTRGLYFNIEDLPFIKITNNNQLMSLINNTNEDDIRTNIDKFITKLGIFENGQASKSIANIIINQMEM